MSSGSMYGIGMAWKIVNSSPGWPSCLRRWVRPEHAVHAVKRDDIRAFFGHRYRVRTPLTTGSACDESDFPSSRPGIRTSCIHRITGTQIFVPRTRWEGHQEASPSRRHFAAGATTMTPAPTNAIPW